MTTYSDHEQRLLDQMEIVMQPRSYGVADAVDACARGTLTFAECCRSIDAMGFRTTGIYEAVRARREALATLPPDAAIGRGE